MRYKERKGRREKTIEFTWFSHTPLMKVNYNGIQIYNRITCKGKSNLNLNLNCILNINCLNPMIFSSNQSLNLLTNLKIFSRNKCLDLFSLSWKVIGWSIIHTWVKDLVVGDSSIMVRNLSICIVLGFSDVAEATRKQTFCFLNGKRN